MFDLQIDGRIIRVKPQGAVWSERMAGLSLERAQAKSLVEKIQEHRNLGNRNGGTRGWLEREGQTPRQVTMQLSSVKDVTLTQSFILKILAKKPRTDVELVELFGNYKTSPNASESGIRSRRAELVQAGFVKDTTIRKQLPSGRWAIVWGIPNG